MVNISMNFLVQISDVHLAAAEHGENKPNPHINLLSQVIQLKKRSKTPPTK